ncbi:MAG: GIY-YIG nuclease family protein [FCB group bacterium]|nr:GIY-YIG nuclease family protein [FCB group bacterium]MBL7121863.1 GIY-YIG nuclease family protein [Candidatus Neomarinimicrobiota bacterium]
MQWFVYVIHSDEGLNYVGMTKNIKRRIMQHNTGTNKWTRRGSGWKLIYHESFDSTDEARAREKYFKNNAGREWLKRRGYLWSCLYLS